MNAFLQKTAVVCETSALCCKHTNRIETAVKEIPATLFLFTLSNLEKLFCVVLVFNIRVYYLLNVYVSTKPYIIRLLCNNKSSLILEIRCLAC